MAAKLHSAHAAEAAEEALLKLLEEQQLGEEAIEAEAEEETEDQASSDVVDAGQAVDLTAGLEVINVAGAGLPSRAPTSGDTDMAVQDGDDDGGVSPVLLGVLGLAAIGGTVALVAGGASNKPPVAVDDTFAANEGSGTGNFSVATNDTDPNRKNTLTFAANGTLPAGVSLASNGAVTFDSNNAAYNSLAAGQTQVLTFGYTVTDNKGASDTGTVTLTVTGTNDLPVAVADVAAATEGAAAVTGSVRTNDSDVDTNDVLTYSLNAPVAGLTLNTNGAYSFDPTNAAYNSLSAGQTQVVVANYTVSDGRGGTATSTLTITVTGTNDVPVAVADVATATEGAAAVTGSVATNDSDVDANDVLTYTLNAPVAGLTLNTNGTYSFDPANAAYNSLAAGQTRTVEANYTVSDGRGGTATSTLIITVTGTNDVPVVVADTATATEDAPQVTGTVAANDSDVDATDVLTYTLDAPVAGLLLNNNGTYSFDPQDAAYQSLAAGETRAVVANITVRDGNGGVVPTTLTITVTGTNDAPVAVADEDTATEDGDVVTGSVADNDSDVDNGAVLTYTLDEPVAGLTLDEDGSYSFDPSDEAYQSLAEGETINVVAAYTVTDENGAEATNVLVIAVTGTNDAPVAVADVAAATEDAAPVTGSVATNDSDVDNGAELTYALNAPVAGLTLNADGSHSFDPSNAVYQSLAAGQTQVVVANYTVTDENGATATSTLTITVTGTNDVPVVVADVAAATEDGAVVTGSMRTNDSDVDATDVLTYTLDAPVAGLTLNSNGTYSFDPSNAAYQNLAAGQVRTVVANVTVSDGNGGVVPSTLTITVTGTNDVPVAVADVAAATEDAAPVTGSVRTNDSDVDTTDVLTYTLNAPVAGLTLNSNGTYSFDPSNAAYQSLRSGATQVVVANYTVSDGNGGTATSTLTITVTGTNDAPVITSAAVGSVAENAAVSTVVYDASATDIDVGDSVSFSISGADAAAFNIDPLTGEIRLNAPANFERKNSYSVTVTATDNGNPALSDTQALIISITDEIDPLSLDVGGFENVVTVDAGVQPGDVLDTNFGFTETSGEGTEVEIVNFGANDFIFFEGLDPSDYTFQNDGNGNLVISRLDDDGFTTNVITLVGTAEGGIDPNALIVTEADAEAALAALLGAGDYFRGSADPVEVQTTGTASFNAAGAKATFIEDLGGQESSIIINNFRADDLILFINGDFGEVFFSTDPDDAKDLRIEYFDFNTNQASTIILNDVLDENGPFVFDEASAEAALAETIGVGDYFQIG